jgi:hypothetical protein
MFEYVNSLINKVDIRSVTSRLPITLSIVAASANIEDTPLIVKTYLQLETGVAILRQLNNARKILRPKTPELSGTPPAVEAAPAAELPRTPHEVEAAPAAELAGTPHAVEAAPAAAAPAAELAGTPHAVEATPAPQLPGTPHAVEATPAAELAGTPHAVEAVQAAEESDNEPEDLLEAAMRDTANALGGMFNRFRKRSRDDDDEEPVQDRNVKPRSA